LKKFERAWDLVIRIKQLSQLRPLLEAVLAPVAASVTDHAPEGLTNNSLPVIAGAAEQPAAELT
jgi:hypothetical protein